MTDRSSLRALDEYVQQLTEGASPGQLLDVRWAPPQERMRRRFVPVRTPATARRLIEAKRDSADVYVGVALRDRRSGRKGAISGSRLLFVECDRDPDPGVLAELPPTIDVASGTPEHRHLYWRLETLASPEEVERTNRRLALALGGDTRCLDVGRILRPPQTLNHKHEPARAVELLALREGLRYSLSALLDALPPAEEPPTPAPPPAAPSARPTALDLRIRAIPARDYALALTGRRANRQGKVLCPFHQERHASLHLYPDGSFYCFGCGRGGSIIDFAALLWGYETYGAEFLALRARLARQFGLTENG